MNQRLVKYRGLSWDKKTWHFGVPISLTQEFCSEGIVDGIRTSWEENEDIDHETLGQFTGFQDSKGTHVYEGDLLKSLGVDICEVRWDDARGMFYLIVINPDNEDISTTYNLDVHVFKYREVIGNIYQKNKIK